MEGIFCMAASTENESFSMEKEAHGKGMLDVTLSHSPLLDGVPTVRTHIQVWSHNKPIMLFRHQTTNVSEQAINDVKLFKFTDFDVGGPASYKDDKGVYDPEANLMMVYDGNPLLVALTARPGPDRWEIAPPTKLMISEEYPDLQNNLELGPTDVAVGLQWNLGNLRPGESRSVDIILMSATSHEEIKALIPEGWKLFNKKIR